MLFEWDNAKNEANIAKHGISFDQAMTVFDGYVYTLRSDRGDEAREVSIGLYATEFILTVVHTDRNGKKRIISARPAKRKERQLYEKALQQATYH